MVFSKSKRIFAQGTVEYLIILSVVVVIALIAVGATFFAINPAPLQQKASVEALKILDVAISETSFNNSTTEFFIKLKNNFSSRINITNIKIGDVNTNFDQNLLAGASSIFIISGSAECVNNEVLKDVVITFESKYGLEHLQSTNRISFACNGADIFQNLRFFYIPNQHIEDGTFFKIKRFSDLNYSLNGELDSNGTLPSGLVAYYKLNESSGTNIVDSSGNNNDGVSSVSKEFVRVTTDGDYTVYTFISDGTISVVSDVNVSVLVVAGGGGGGGTIAGGGGAGGLIYNSNYSLTPGTKTITVGDGGIGGLGWNYYPNFGANGENSVFDSLTAIGGGGGHYNSYASTGGSGSGGSYTPYNIGANGTTGQGNKGGNGDSTSNVAGGGGGAGGVGANSSGINSGNGGVGLAYDINGTLVYYAGGGGGGTRNAGVAGIGGLGGGGSGTKTSSKAGNGLANTGGGGGGAGYTGGNSSLLGGNGGSGVVIIRVLTSLANNISVVEEPVSGLWETNALIFDNSITGVTFSNSAFAQTTTTFSAWVYLNSITDELIWVKSSDNENTYNLISIGSYSDYTGWKTTGDEGRIYYHGENYQTLLSSNSLLSTGQWYHIVVEASPTEGSIYINGLLDKTSSGDYSWSNDVSVTKQNLGIWYISGAIQSVFNGIIEDVAIFDRTLSSEEILSIYNYSANSSYITKPIDTKKPTSNFDSVIINPNGLKYGEEIDPTVETNLTNGLVGLWHLNENALDSSGNENISAWVGSTTYSSGLWDTNSANFDGSGNYISVSNFGNVLPTSEISVSLWVNIPYSTQNSAFILNADNPANRLNFHACYSNGNTYWDFGNISTTGRLSYANPLGCIGQWNHYVLVSSVLGNYMRIYRNGVLEASKTGAGVFTNYLANLQIGGNSAHYFTGKMEELAIWNRALSEIEINELFTKSTSKFGVEARSCSSSDCTDSSWSEKQYGSNDLKYFSLPRNKYFQFRITPELIPFEVPPVAESCVSQYGEYYWNNCYEYFGDYESCSAFDFHNYQCEWNSYGYGSPQWWVYEPFCVGSDSYNSTCNYYQVCDGTNYVDCSATDESTCNASSPYCYWDGAAEWCYSADCSTWNNDAYTCYNAGCNSPDYYCNNDYYCEYDYSNNICNSRAYYYGCSYWNGYPSECFTSGCYPNYCSNYSDSGYWDYDYWNFYEYYYPSYPAHGSEAIDYYTEGMCYWNTYYSCDNSNWGSNPLYCEDQLNYGESSCRSIYNCTYTPRTELTYKYFVNSNPKVTDLNVVYRN